MTGTATLSTPTFSKPARIADWGLRGLIAVAFIAAGGAKLAGAPPMVELFTSIGLGQWLRHVTAAFEIGGAVLILVPSLAIFGALLLAGTMAVAVLTHFALIGGNPAPAITLLVLNLVVLWMHRAAVAAAISRR